MTDERESESEIGRNETRARKTPPKGGEGEIGGETQEREPTGERTGTTHEPPKPTLASI